MTLREKQIDEFANSQVDCEFFNEDLYEGIIIGAKWADEHPDSKHIYTKQQLIDMGFAFTTNGDIVPPDQLNEDLKKYLEYQKRKFIEKSRKWLQENLSEGFDPDNYPMVRCYDIDMEDFIKDFIREMEE